jgi:hypothetical protein
LETQKGDDSGFSNVITQKIELRILNDVPIHLDQNSKLIKQRANFVVDTANNVYDYDEYVDIDLNGEPKHKLKLIGEIVVYDGDDYPEQRGKRMVKLGFF